MVRDRTIGIPLYNLSSSNFKGMEFFCCKGFEVKSKSFEVGWGEVKEGNAS